MRSRPRWIPVLAFALCAGALGAGPAYAAAPAPVGSPLPRPSLHAEERYWTADRMENAVPVDPAPAALPGVAPRRPAPPGTPDPEHFGGHPTVGTFFFDGEPLGGKSTYCTGSVVHTAAKDIVLTAGHCGIGLAGATHRVFVPQYLSGKPAAEQPYGVFPVSHMYLDPRYEKNTKKATSDLDLAFAQVDPGSGGELEDVTGALTFTSTASYTHKVTAIGYPSSEKVNPGHGAIRCPVTTSRLPGFRQLRMTCTGFYGGVSGGPWIEDYDPATGTGEVIGETGGYNGGGNDADDDWVTYAPVYGKDAQALFDDAAAHRAVGARQPYRPATDSPWLPGSAPTWQHARLLASGDFRHTGHSDMIVVWTDGEVTLYPGDGHGGYGPERQLLAHNGTWTHASAVTAGDFTGSDQFDLLVRWSDGEVTLFGDIGAKGLHRAGTRMAKPNNTWTKAVQITAGRFTDQPYVTDLVVRWANGEVSLYTGVRAGSFGHRHRLKSADSTWRNTTLLGSGDFSGHRKWDLMVRRSDGALDTYAGTSTSGLGTARRVLKPNTRWTQATAMATGEFTGNGRTDDLVVRWSSGETSMYTDTLADRLGTEHMLVAPTS